MRTPRNLLIFIIVITIFAILIDLPPQVSIFNKTFQGFNPNTVLRIFGIQKDFSFRKGLDLAGGTSITLRANMSEIPEAQRIDALDAAKSVIEKRVNFFGVSEPIIQSAKVQNDYRIIVEIPGISDVDQAIKLIGTTAQLTFWEQGASGSAILNQELLPIGLTQIFSDSKKTELTGNDLEKASVSFDQNTGEPQVQLTFTAQGAKEFADITKRNVGKRVAIVLDNQVIQAPVVQTVIVNGDAVITGGFTTDQAKAVAIQLNAGALPVSLSVLEQRAIGATLGERSLEKSLFAGVLGFFVIVIFMVILYGRQGGIASLALFLYALFVLALFKIIPITLTLAGIAGFVLSIGMAVDANILIFERMKEELRAGKPMSIAVELGFSRAWSSIRDSNISSIITSIILLYFGTGLVRGFAITLLIGVLVSMFSAITVTRTFLRMIYKS